MPTLVGVYEEERTAKAVAEAVARTPGELEVRVQDADELDSVYPECRRRWGSCSHQALNPLRESLDRSRRRGRRPRVGAVPRRELGARVPCPFVPSEPCPCVPVVMVDGGHSWSLAVN